MTSPRATAPNSYGALRLVSGTLTFASTTVTLEALEVGDVVVQAWAEVTQVFNAATTNVITLGNTATTDKFLAAADVAEGATGVTPTGGKGPYTAETVASNLIATYAQTGTPATTGAAKVYALVTSIPV